MLIRKGSEMNREAAKSTLLIVMAFVAFAMGTMGMMMVAPQFTVTALAIAGVVFMVRAIYQIELARIKCEQSQADLKNL
jgi:hypothetical protein